MREGRSNATWNQKGRRGGNARKKGHEVPLGAAKGSEKKQAGGRQGRGYVVVKPSEAAKGAGMPKSLIVTGPAVGGRAGPRLPLLPRETRMRSLRTGEDHLPAGRRNSGRRQTHFQALVSHERDTGAPVDSAAPIEPEQRGRTHAQRMEQPTSLSRLCGGVTLPLALLTQRAGPTTADAGSIDHAQAAVGFPPLLMRDQLLRSRAT